MALLEVEKLTVIEPRSPTWGRVGTDPSKLVDGVSFSVPPGQCVAIVGEHHSGTLPLTFALLGLAHVAEGRVVFNDREITNLSDRQMRPIRRQMPALFSDDFGSLPPHQTIDRILIGAHACGGGSRDKGDRIREIQRAMERAGLPLSSRHQYPRDLGPGDRQRTALARALLQQPRMLILRDFTRGLDPSLQAVLLNRLSDLKEELGLALLLITHDLAVADHMAPEIHVMSRGKIVDSGPRDSVISDPQHDYTRRLIASAVTLRA
ncbi:MAG: ATP-binding cassette domain-containing protein [Verrucomicrobiae bacterium]|nr:ATP-binding cassette domain-containing protein [Verrucomicrobiae bacterium]